MLRHLRHGEYNLKPTITREQLIAELKRINQEFPNQIISRDFFRANSRVSAEAISQYYSGFPAFREAVLGRVPRNANPSAKSTKPEPVALPIDRRVEIEKEKITSRTSEWKQKFEHVAHEASRLKAELEAVIDLKSRNPEIINILPKLPSGESESVAVVLLSDWHSEENVTLAQTSGRNSFNLEICKERVVRCFQGVQRLWEINNRDTGIRTMIIALLGDFISGSIHADLAEGNNLPPADAIYNAQNLIQSGIQFLLDNTDVEEFLVVCHSGNHGRMTHEQRHATEAGNSLEQFMYLNLRDLFAKEPRVKFQVAEGYHSYVNVFSDGPGYKIRFHHGHNLRYSGGVGGIYIPVNKAVNEWNKLNPARLDCFGHFHQRVVGGNFVCNGSIIGYNAYATSIKAAYERPAQSFFLINKKFNEVTISAPIFVTKGTDRN